LCQTRQGFGSSGQKNQSANGKDECSLVRVWGWLCRLARQWC
jgi:hypothetical protein